MQMTTTIMQCQQGDRYLPVPDDGFAPANNIREQLDALRSDIKTLPSHIKRLTSETTGR